MTDEPKLQSMIGEITPNTADYRQWLGVLKARFRQVQLKAAVAVNTAMLQFYWELGADIVAKQTQFAWGSGFLNQLSADLMREFPDVKGLSKRNLELVRQWHLFWLAAPIGQHPVAQFAKQPVSQILTIPWGHNLAILAKCKQHDEALYYAQATQTYGWSRSVLVHQIENGLWQREGKAITNFEQTLPAAQSDLAIQMLKDPYKFDFLSLTKEHTERELETDLIAHITQFLLELGAGFAYIGRQVPLQVDEQLRGEGDQPTIGLLLCKSKDRLVAEYALSDIQKPMGLSTYTLNHTLPEALRDKLPSIEAIERELGLDGFEGEGV